MDAPQHADNRQFPNPAEMLNAAAMQWARALCHENLHSLLDAHEDRLRHWAQSSAEWLDRRHDFAAESRRLLLRLQSCEDMTDVLAAQSEFAGATWRRLAADCATFTGLAMFMPRASTSASATRTEAAAAKPRGAASTEMRKASLDHLLAARGTRGTTAAASEGDAH